VNSSPKASGRTGGICNPGIINTEGGAVIGGDQINNYGPSAEKWIATLDARGLLQRVETRRVLYMVGDLPDHFTPRPDEYRQAKLALLEVGRTVPVTTALHGAGGYGKTTLANALCRDPDITREFIDGVLRVELGKEIGDVTDRILNLIELIDPKRHRPGITDANTAAGLLAETIGDARILLVIDDVWREPQLRPFLRGGPKCVRLVTTRTPQVLPADHVAIRIDRMSEEQALLTLSSGLPDSNDAGNCHRLAALARRLGFWAQMLAIANGWLGGWARRGATLSEALAEFEHRLIRRGLLGFDPSKETQRNRAIGICFEASLEELDFETERQRLHELAVLPEDTEVPITVITALWAASANMQIDDANDLLNRLDDLSLLQHLDRHKGSVRLHDNLLWYLRDRSKAAGTLSGAHAAMVRAIATRCGGEFPQLAPGETLFWRHLIRHLRNAGQAEQADRLLTDYAWVRAKLRAIGPLALSESYLPEPDDIGSNLVGQAVSLSVPALSVNSDDLPRQIFGRLGHSNLPAVVDLVTAAQADPDFWPVPRWPALSPPGNECLRLLGHEGSVNSVAFSPDGSRIVTASSDRTAHILNARSGELIASLLGHEDAVRSAAFSPDGIRIVTASFDRTARIWDARSGEPIASPLRHEGLVWSAVFSPDGSRIVTASVSVSSNTACIWDAHSSKPIARLRDHGDAVRSVVFSPDGARIATASDRTARVWDARSGAPIASLLGHEDAVRSAAFSPDGMRIVTSSYDRTALIWDACSGAPIVSPYKHRASIDGAAFSPDGTRIVTSSYRIARIWDARSGKPIASLRDYEDVVESTTFSPESTRFGDTARIWNVRSRNQIASLRGHGSVVRCAAFLPDGTRLVTTSSDHTARIWDARFGVPIACIVLDAAVTALDCYGEVLALGDGLGKLHVFDAK
jgi:WD40 repeat protein